MTVVTERLTLDPIGAGDVDFVLDLYARPEVARWSGTGQVKTSREQALSWLVTRPERIGDHPAAGLFVVRAGEPVGLALLVPLPPSDGTDLQVHEVGWHFLPSAWGKGYATEAGAALAQRALDAGMPEVWAVTHPDNTASQAVCRRLGMTDLGLTSLWYGRELRTFRLDRSGFEKRLAHAAH